MLHDSMHKVIQDDEDICDDLTPKILMKYMLTVGFVYYLYMYYIRIMGTYMST